MRTKTLTTASIGLGMLFFLQGCMAIRSTEGVKAYLKETAKAEIEAVKLKDRFSGKESNEYKKAERLYDDAAAASNGWLKGLVFDAKSKNKFDVTIETYENSDAHKAIKLFLNESSLLPGVRYKTKGFDPITATAILNFSTLVIQKIVDMHNKQVQEAIERITEQLNISGWTTFSNISRDYIDKKYLALPHIRE